MEDMRDDGAIRSVYDSHNENQGRWKKIFKIYIKKKQIVRAIFTNSFTSLISYFL